MPLPSFLPSKAEILDTVFNIRLQIALFCRSGKIIKVGRYPIFTPENRPKWGAIPQECRFLAKIRPLMFPEAGTFHSEIAEWNS